MRAVVSLPMLDDLNSPLDLVDARLGPVDIAVTGDRIEFFVDATGDDPDRWVDTAPPGFASVLLFGVADLFLYHPKVVPFTATLLHLDQSFTYRAPMRAGTTITMDGTVTRVRERSGSFFVTFDAEGIDDLGAVVSSSSTFVLSDQQAPAPDVELTEPAVRDKGVDMGHRRSASRHDLVRYAAATRDFNPLHWDHDVAVESGLPGTVVHGLLMYAWMVQAASADAGAAGITESRIRFRSALHPGEQATIRTARDGRTVGVELLRDATVLVTGTATVDESPDTASE
jgi:acyl dehydratase